MDLDNGLGLLQANSQALILAPQQGADLATTFAGIGLGQDAQLVLGAESAPLGLRYDFRVSLHRRRSGRSVLRYC